MKKPRFSLGSIVMLLATLFVVIGMAAFLTLIAGDGVYERTRAVFGLLADQIEEATATPTGVPTASPMPESTEGPTPSPSPTATPALEPKRLTIAAAGTIYAPKTVRESVQEGTDHYDFMTTFEGLSRRAGKRRSLHRHAGNAGGRARKGIRQLQHNAADSRRASGCRREFCVAGDGTRAG